MSCSISGAGLVSSWVISQLTLTVWLASLGRRDGDGHNSCSEVLPFWELWPSVNLLNLLIHEGTLSPQGTYTLQFFTIENRNKLQNWFTAFFKDFLRILISLVANIFALQCWVWQVLNHTGKRHFCLLLCLEAQRHILRWMEKVRRYHWTYQLKYAFLYLTNIHITLCSG